MTEKTFRDELAMSLDVDKYDFGTFAMGAKFAGVVCPEDNDIIGIVQLSIVAQAKLRYMYADAMIAASGREVKASPVADAEGWIVHDGKGIPCQGNIKVDVKFRDGLTDDWHVNSWQANSWSWEHRGTNGDIIAWRPAR